MDASSIDGSTVVLATLGGSVTLGTVIMLVMQIIKGFFPTLEGRRAEACVLAVSYASVAYIMAMADADFTDPYVLGSVAGGGLLATVLARGAYSQLFKVGVSGLPPSPDASVPVEAVNDPQARDGAA